MSGARTLQPLAPVVEPQLRVGAPPSPSLIRPQRPAVKLAPSLLSADFARAGADLITVHVEVCPHLHRTLQAIKDLGVKAGVALNPATSLATLEETLRVPDVDLALIISVNPGFGGQSYIPSSTAKIQRLRQMLDAIGSAAWLEVDGGIKPGNAAEVVRAGATVLVAGSAVFGGPHSVAENVATLCASMAGC